MARPIKVKTLLESTGFKNGKDCEVWLDQKNELIEELRKENRHLRQKLKDLRQHVATMEEKANDL